MSDSGQTPSDAAALAVVYRKIDSLVPDPKNPRKHSPKQIAQIAASVEAFGFNVPVLVDGRGKILAGHGRVLACKKLGWREVPTISLAHLTEAQAKAFMIADNRLTENSVWDDQLLAEALKDLSLGDLKFLEATGFEMGEIDLKIQDLDVASGEMDEGDLALSAGPAVTRLGDLWTLGQHRILCGNAMDEASYASLLVGAQAAMVLSDPPYNVRIEGNVSGLGSVKHSEFVMASGEMTDEEFQDFLDRLCKLLVKHSLPGSLHYLFMDWRHIAELLAVGKSAYSELKNICVWVKTNAGMGSLYRSQHELVAVFKNGEARHRNNIQLGRFGRNRTNVWSYPGMTSFGRTGEEGGLNALHPTVKPLTLVADAILDASARQDVVLDPFLGSGTTLIAAEKVGRRCFGMELDPAFVDVAIRRWQRWSGEPARLGELTFDDIAAQRKASHGDR